MSSSGYRLCMGSSSSSASEDTIGAVGELAVLARIFPRLPEARAALLGPGDDAAVIAAPDGRFVVTTDMMIHGPDFRLAWSRPHDLGWKAAASGLDVKASTKTPVPCSRAVSTIGVRLPNPRYGEAVIASLIGDDASVAARVDRIQAHRDGLERLAELLRRVESAGSIVDKAQAAVDGAVETAGFASMAAALAAIRTPQRRAAINEALAAAAERSASARSVLAEPEVVAVDGLEAVVLDTYEQTAGRAATELEAAISAYTQADGRRRAVQAQFDSARTEVAKLAPIEQRHGSLAALADVMIGDGQNMRRISLRTYVLAAKLEDVVVVASQRLRTMSGGRFEFVHSDGTIGRERRGGLALDILDANTGSVRPTSTLSGGETFMASLALALGLADVGAEDTGGIQLETLFIDEGFGTLDAEALDLVMGVLDELRAGGRSVGIVSHVAEMQHRIPTRLFVKKGEAGSTLQMIGA